MTTTAYDVVAIGNAIVDILSPADDAFITAEGMTKGSMQLMFSPQEADALYAKMGPGTEASGGSAENTVAGVAALGGRTGFIGQVADDQLGQVFAHDIRAAGVAFGTAASSGLVSSSQITARPTSRPRPKTPARAPPRQRCGPVWGRVPAAGRPR